MLLSLVVILVTLAGVLSPWFPYWLVILMCFHTCTSSTKCHLTPYTAYKLKCKRVAKAAGRPQGKGLGHWSGQFLLLVCFYFFFWRSTEVPMEKVKIEVQMHQVKDLSCRWHPEVMTMTREPVIPSTSTTNCDLGNSLGDWWFTVCRQWL